MSIFATIKWDTGDIGSLRMDWSDEKLQEAADFCASTLTDRSIELGWEVLSDLLIMFEEGSKDTRP